MTTPNKNRPKIETEPDILKTKPFQAKNASQEAAALNAVVGFMNNPAISGAVVPAEEKANLVIKPGLINLPAQEAQKEPPRPSEEPLPDLSGTTKVFFTGRMKVGKDYTATKIGAHILGVADPLYALFERWFGVKCNKDLTGAREWLQAVGQWGRATLSDHYPMSPLRSMFTHIVHLEADVLAQEWPQFKLDWRRFGTTPDFWIDGVVARAKEWADQNPGERLAITNARFQNEISKLSAAGFLHLHVMCSADTWGGRLKKAGMLPTSQACKDVSENIAVNLDATCWQSFKAPGQRLRVVWSDEHAAAPSKRVWTPEILAQAMTPRTITEGSPL